MNHSLADVFRLTEINKILKSKEINSKLVEMGAEVLGGTPAEFAKFTASELKR